jgi:transposase-like protein
MNQRNKRTWSAEEKLRILEEARQSGQAVSEVCRRHQIAPAQFYLWEKQARQGALVALRPGTRGRKPASAETLLTAEVERLRAAVTELTLENLQFKRGPWR